MNYTFRIIAISACCLLIVVTACDLRGGADSSTPIPASAYAPESDEAILNRILLPLPSELRTSKTDLDIISEDHGVAFHTLVQLIPNLVGRTTSEREELIQAEINEADPDYVWAVESIMAQYFLDALHSREEARDYPEMVEKYTLLLIKHENQRADLMVPSLEILDGLWSFQQRQDAASDIVANAEAWLADVDAFLEEGGANVEEPHASGVDDNISRISNGVLALRSTYNLP